MERVHRGSSDITPRSAGPGPDESELEAEGNGLRPLRNPWWYNPATCREGTAPRTHAAGCCKTFNPIPPSNTAVSQPCDSVECPCGTKTGLTCSELPYIGDYPIACDSIKQQEWGVQSICVFGTGSAASICHKEMEDCPKGVWRKPGCGCLIPTKGNYQPGKPLCPTSTIAKLKAAFNYECCDPCPGQLPLANGTCGDIAALPPGGCGLSPTWSQVDPVYAASIGKLLQIGQLAINDIPGYTPCQTSCGNKFDCFYSGLEVIDGKPIGFLMKGQKGLGGVYSCPAPGVKVCSKPQMGADW